MICFAHPFKFIYPRLLVWLKFIQSIFFSLCHEYLLWRSYLLPGIFTFIFCPESTIPHSPNHEDLRENDSMNHHHFLPSPVSPAHVIAVYACLSPAGDFHNSDVVGRKADVAGEHERWKTKRHLTHSIRVIRCYPVTPVIHLFSPVNCDAHRSSLCVQVFAVSVWLILQPNRRSTTETKNVRVCCRSVKKNDPLRGLGYKSIHTHPLSPVNVTHYPVTCLILFLLLDSPWWMLHHHPYPI